MAQTLAMAASQISEPINTMAPMAVRNATNLVLEEGTAMLSAEGARAGRDAECGIFVYPKKALLNSSATRWM